MPPTQAAHKTAQRMVERGGGGEEPELEYMRSTSHPLQIQRAAGMRERLLQQEQRNLRRIDGQQEQTLHSPKENSLQSSSLLKSKAALQNSNYNQALQNSLKIKTDKDKQILFQQFQKDSSPLSHLRIPDHKKPQPSTSSRLNSKNEKESEKTYDQSLKSLAMKKRSEERV